MRGVTGMNVKTEVYYSLELYFFRSLFFLPPEMLTFLLLFLEKEHFIVNGVKMGQDLGMGMSILPILYCNVLKL